VRLIINNFVTLLKVGYFPYFPGTVGSFFSYIILIIFNIYLSYLSLIFFFVLIFIISIYFINIYSKDLKNHDPKEIVIDEFLGCFLIFLFYPFFKENHYFLFLIISFILFRFFDIFKLFPINLIDKNIKNSYGVILDDIVAGIYTIISLKIIYVYIL
tara:strand:- start:228 stop:698 length:471 start_codon:yes stop_codon:yes gene_type:complete